MLRLLCPAVAVLRWEGVLLLAALGFGTASALATRWFVAFILIAAAFLLIAWVRAYGGSDRARRFRQRAQAVGYWVWALLIAFIGLAIVMRFSLWWTAALFTVGYFAAGSWHLFWMARRGAESSLPFRQAVALTIVPVLLAWVVNSTIYKVYSGVISGAQLDGASAVALQDVRDQRAERLAEVDGSIALALSGGGYRAAAMHAGILWVLEEAGLPLEYLSTVSGGSIVGGSYAMGMTAGNFRDHLMAARPGLPNDLTNFYAVVSQLLIPNYGSGDTYAGHFDRVYFDSRKLEATGPPVLIANATRYSDGTRRAFMAETDGDLSLARVVAASGAFPVAFDPVVIEGEGYMDGGVVENLGIGGLQQYFERHAGDTDIADRLPDVLILSDAGLIPEAPENWNKPSVLQMAVRAQQTSYFAMHRWIYSFYTDGEYDRVGNGELQQPFRVTAGRLWPELPESQHAHEVSVFVFSPSSPAERQVYAGNEALLDAVSAIDTLKELRPEEVEAAFWVGAKLAHSYLPELCAAAGVSCAPVTLDPVP